jgi:hypothetical protein
LGRPKRRDIGINSLDLLGFTRKSFLKKKEKRSVWEPHIALNYHQVANIIKDFVLNEFSQITIEVRFSVQSVTVVVVA